MGRDQIRGGPCQRTASTPSLPRGRESRPPSVFRHVQYMGKTDTFELTRHFKYISRYEMVRAIDSLCALKLVRRYPEMVGDTDWKTVIELYEPE